MKLYSASKAPSPRRVVMLLAEKSLLDQVEIVSLDLAAGDNLRDEFVQQNPMAKVPMLALSSGECLSEAGAINRYLDQCYPEPNLCGVSPLEQAHIDMWDRHVEIGLLYPVGMAFQHGSGFFKDRMTPVPAWGQECARSAVAFLQVLEQQLARYAYVAGERFTVADITALCALDFAKVIQVRIDDRHPSIQRWYAECQARPSYAASWQ